MAEMQKTPSLLESLESEFQQNRQTEKPSEASNVPLEQGISEERSGSFQSKYPAAWTTTVSPEQKRDLSWSDVGSEAVRSAPGSLARAAVATVQPFIHPIETGKSLYGVGKGLVSKAGLIPGQSAKEKAEAEATVNALGEFYANRYGSMAGFKQALAEDPASVLMDLSLPLTMGGAGLARIPGVIGTVGKGLSTAGKLTDPLTAIPTAVGAIPGVKTGLSAAGDYLAKPFESRAGVIPGGVSTAAKAGYTGGQEFEPFVAQMRGKVPPTDIVTQVEDTIQGLAAKRKADYLKGMGQPLTKKIVDLAPIQKLVNERLADTAHLSSGATMKAVADALDEFQTKGMIKGYRGSPGYKVPDPMNPTIYDVDRLKQHVADLVNDPTLPGGAVASEVASNIGKEIRKVDKGYADIMDRYGDATEQLKRFRVGAGKSGQIPEVRLAKIMKGAKDKYKGTIFDEMVKENPDLAMALKGQSMAHWEFPSPLELAAVGGAGTYLSAHPVGGVAALAADVISKNPRLLGELAYGAGKTVRLAEKAGESGVLPITRQIGYQQMRDALEERKRKELEESAPFNVSAPVRADGGRVARADGGRIDVQRGVRALMKAVEDAKKSVTKSTESLLELPDEHVAQTLDAAKRHI